MRARQSCTRQRCAQPHIVPARSLDALLAPLRRLGLKKPPAPSIVFDDDDYDDEENVWCPLDECEIPPEASSLESSFGERSASWARPGNAGAGLAGPRAQAAGQARVDTARPINLEREQDVHGLGDVDLSPIGETEMEHAARLMLERGLQADVVYTSVLKQAIRSAWILLAELGQTYRPVVKDWRLNERHYGALQSRSKVGLVVSSRRRSCSHLERATLLGLPNCRTRMRCRPREKRENTWDYRAAIYLERNL